MLSAYVVGLDLGTSSAKVCAMDLEGRTLGLAHSAYPTHTPHPGWAEQDPEDWIPALATALRRLFATGLDPAGLRGLALSCAAHIGVLLDADDHPLRQALLWHDQRSRAEAAELARSRGAEIYALGHNWPSTTWTLAHLRWMARHEPALWKRGCRLLGSKDYVGWKLTGRRVTDPASAVGLLLYNVHQNCWDASLCALAGLAPSALPDVLPSGALVGRLSSAGARALGVPEGVPLFNGTLDSIAETLRAGVRPEADMLIRLATAGGIHRLSSLPVPDPKLITYPYPLGEGLWLQQAGTNSCASAVAWAARLLQDNETPDYALWDALAARAEPGARGLLFHPYLAGERCPYWDPELQGAFSGLHFQHGRPELARAVYEGVSLSLRDALRVFGADTPSVPDKRVCLVGGGSQSRVWSGIVASVMNCEVLAMPDADSSGGAALMALWGLGVCKPGEELPQGPQTRFTLSPSEAERRVYDQLFAAYLRSGPLQGRSALSSTQGQDAL